MITKALLYCTKNKPELHKAYDNSCYIVDKEFIKEMEEWDGNFQTPSEHPILNGHVVAVCDIEVEEVRPFFHWCKQLEKATCLTCDEVLDYLDKKDKSVSNPKRQAPVYLIHIKNLKVFDEPLTIEKLYQPIDNNFCKRCREYKTCEYAKSKGKPCKKVLLYAPQNMYYCWYNGEKYALISIQPQWLVKILNGEKTIEVRKKVLKEMIK